MNKRKVDKTKSSNIKCEHCRWWHYCKPNGDNEYKCHNPQSIKYNIATNYYNRCKSFEWKSCYKREDDKVINADNLKRIIDTKETCILELIDEEPALYSIRKIVEQLEEIKSITSTIGNYEGCTKQKFEILAKIDDLLHYLAERGDIDD